MLRFQMCGEAPSPTLPGASRTASAGEGARSAIGDARWLRLTEERAGRTKSVFQFGGYGSVARSAHAGIVWLRFMRQQLGRRVHFWPFDGWEIPAGRSAVAEVCPALWRCELAREGRTDNQQEAHAAAAWLRRADGDGSLAGWLAPGLTPAERAVAEVEGWILGASAVAVRRRRARRRAPTRGAPARGWAANDN